MPAESTLPRGTDPDPTEDYLTTREAYNLLKVSRATFNRVYRKLLVQDHRTRWTPTGLPRYARSSILALYQARPQPAPPTGPAVPLPPPTAAAEAPPSASVKPKRRPAKGRHRPEKGGRDAGQIPLLL